MYILAMRKWVAHATTGHVFHSAVDSPLGRITWDGKHLNRIITARMQMRYWDTYAIVYVLNGHARFHDQDGLNRVISPGDLVLLFPRHGYRYVVSPQERWSEFFVQFRGPLFGLWMKEGLLDPGDPIHHLTPIDHWWGRLESVIEPMDLPEPTQSLTRVCRLQQFLIDAMAAPRRASDAGRQRWLTEARAVLDGSPGKQLQWNDVARSFHMSFRQFRRKFTELSGTPPGRYRASRIIEQAQHLLGDGGLSIKEIAERCGFCDEFHFAKRFKAVTGLTPAQFRRRLM